MGAGVLLFAVIGAAIVAAWLTLATLVWPSAARLLNAASLSRLANRIDAASSSVGAAAEATLRPGRDALLVFAHPDDEAMFFTPTLAALRRGGHAVHFLCFSSGNYNGLGAVRAAELKQSGRVYGAASVSVVEDGRTQDGPARPWDTGFIAARVAEVANQHPVGVIVTFDSRGVSSHPNHIDVHRGVSLLLQRGASTEYGLARPCTFFELRTHHFARKYSSFLELLPWWSESRAFANAVARRHVAAGGIAAAAGFGLELRFVVPRSQALLSLRGMQAHPSQLVWFRYLFVVFSQYGFMNVLVPMT